MFLTAATLGLALAAQQPAPVKASPELAPSATLRIGDKAPSIEIEHWLLVPEGVAKEVKPGAGKVYVLDFWATWCAPCIAEMPHISELQRRHKSDGVVIVAVSDEEPGVVNAFLDKPAGDGKRRDALDHAIAADPDRSTHEALLVATGDVSIPRAIIVGKDGLIEWIGHPGTDDLDGALAQIVAGTWDRDAWRKRVEEQMSFDRRFSQALADERWEAAAEMAGEDWRRLNDVAWRIAFDPDGRVKNRDFRLAQNFATTSLQISNGEESFPIFTLAQVEAERGQFDKAVELAKRALKVEGASGPWRGFYESSLAVWERAAESMPPPQPPRRR